MLTGSAVPSPLTVSVIVPCRNEVRYIGPCLDSILATGYPAGALEVLVADGRSDDGTREIVARYARRDPRVRLVDNPGRIVPTGLNRAIRAATGAVIIRMDAHVVYPPAYIPRLVAALEETGADNVGTAITTVPADQSPVARAVALALAHPMGVGNSYFRIGTGRDRWVDTVPFGCYRREVFDRVGLFDEDLVRNQDDEFNHRLLRHGGRIRLVSDVRPRYHARPSLRHLARMYGQYGRFKPLAAARVGRVTTVRQLVPPAFVVSLAVLAILAPVWTPAAWLLVGVVGAWGLALVLAALPAARQHGPRCGAALVAAFATLHLSYGWGFLRGLWDLVTRRSPGPAAVPLTR